MTATKEPRFGVKRVCNIFVCKSLSSKIVVVEYLPSRFYRTRILVNSDEKDYSNQPTLMCALIALAFSSGKARSSSTYLLEMTKISASFRSTLNMEFLNYGSISRSPSRVVIIAEFGEPSNSHP